MTHRDPFQLLPFCDSVLPLPWNVLPRDVCVCTVNWIPNLRIAQMREIGLLMTNPRKQVKMRSEGPCHQLLSVKLLLIAFRQVVSRQGELWALNCFIALLSGGISPAAPQSCQGWAVIICWKRAVVGILSVWPPFIVDSFVKHRKLCFHPAAVFLLCLE